MLFGGLDCALARASATRAVSGIFVVVIVDLVFLEVILFVFVVAGDSVLDALRQTIAVKCLGDIWVLCNRCEQALVDGLAGIGLLNDAEHTVVQVLVELLRVGKGDRASGASTSNTGLRATESLAARWALLAAVGRVLLDTVNRCKMPLEDISAVERLLSR